MICQMIGFHHISTIGFGLMTVSSASLVHSHHARITVFIWAKKIKNKRIFSYFNCLTSVCIIIWQELMYGKNLNFQVKVFSHLKKSSRAGFLDFTYNLLSSIWGYYIAIYKYCTTISRSSSISSFHSLFDKITLDEPCIRFIYCLIM